ncbi:carbon monoxide dehydrogenase subunit G [Planomonospora parontospora subsp. parontospora]|uniref:Carbon monoxide dehydrogenase subunit G n=2 Tax=Planomonospora parontospora TaxID=58119 RepID=A0AA37BEE0_9ACTN|nr:SRPBCC family protein [Planomonospora parontospora]GGK55872.1 carbon monoxide dehydrogenase subunit G [Planomonospora parontospora]GII07324.1 carbon monoxide dehydrogenase subunit G [Planomonospora parontospora subsp. parontospora]
MAMRFEHEFTVPVPVEQAWAVLLDVERVAPCLPGAVLDTVEGDSFTGRLKVKVGPITVTYRGSAAFEDVDKDAHTAVLKASGKEARGSGTAAATVTARLLPEGTGTRVAVGTSFNVTGRPAQFGRGVMAEVGARLIDRFAANLSGLLSEPAAGEPSAPDGTPAAPAPETAGSGPTGEAGAAVSETASGAGADGPDGPDGPPGTVHPIRRLTAVPSSGETPAMEEARQQDVHPAGTARTSRTPDEEALDLLEVAGVPLLRRAAPFIAALTGLVLLAWLARRLLRHR